MKRVRQKVKSLSMSSSILISIIHLNIKKRPRKGERPFIMIHAVILLSQKLANLIGPNLLVKAYKSREI